MLHLSTQAAAAAWKCNWCIWLCLDPLQNLFTSSYKFQQLFHLQRWKVWLPVFWIIYFPPFISSSFISPRLYHHGTEQSCAAAQGSTSFSLGRGESTQSLHMRISDSYHPLVAISRWSSLFTVVSDLFLNHKQAWNLFTCPAYGLVICSSSQTYDYSRSDVL